MDLKKLYETQISLTEWYEKIGHKDATAMRLEDNEKRERLRVLNEVIGLPFDRPFQCAATDIAERTPLFVEYFGGHRDELCALRLIPLDPELPKLRMRGMTVAEVVADWFPKQGIDPARYRADFVPHPADHVWSTIFVVTPDGVRGEIIRGGHNQLTQGFHTDGTPIVFSSTDFSSWELSEEDPAVRGYLDTVIAMLRVDDFVVRDRLSRDLAATFASDHLVGYFETVASTAFGTWFIDYNRLLVQQIAGRTGSRGKATGPVRVVLAEKLDVATIEAGDILICDMTTPDHLPLMLRAGAIVTNLGGILTHAAIVCRELGKPCVVGTKNATETFADGEIVEVDADAGTVTRMS